MVTELSGNLVSLESYPPMFDFAVYQSLITKKYLESLSKRLETLESSEPSLRVRISVSKSETTTSSHYANTMKLVH